MRRALALLALALGTSGCFVSLGNLGLLRGERPLEEKMLEGSGRAKVLLVLNAVADAEDFQIPDAELVSEERGETPLAWRGARLSVAIADFLERRGLRNPRFSGGC